MEHAPWRNYRGHSIVERRSPVLRRRRYELRKGGKVIATFGTAIGAERYVDAQLAQ